MGSAEEKVYCRNCGELLYRVVHEDDGSTRMKDFAPEPQREGAQQYFRCPTCRGKNLVTLVRNPAGSRYYEVVGFVRS